MLKKIKWLWIIFFSLGVLQSAVADESAPVGWADLILNVANIRNTHGTVKIELFNSEQSYRRSGDEGLDAFRVARSKINQDGTLQVIFKNIPSGEYAIKIFHDEDNSGIIKRNWHDRPTEDYGFSNNVNADFDMPEFLRVKFDLDEMHESQTIVMQRALAK